MAGCVRLPSPATLPTSSRPRLPHTAFNYLAYYCVLLLDKKKTTTKKHTHAQGRTHYTARNEEPESVARGPAEGTAVFTSSEIHKTEEPRGGFRCSGVTFTCWIRHPAISRNHFRESGEAAQRPQDKKDEAALFL